MFEILLEDDYVKNNNTSNMPIKERKAIRGVIKIGNKLLMVKNNKGDYKFPGGGMEKGETILQTLHREVLEETGFNVIEVGEKLGEVIQRKLDTIEDSKIFLMKSVYIECSVNINDKHSQNLDNYEKEQEFTPVLIDINEVITKQEEILKSQTKDSNDWVERETTVLKLLREYCF